MAHLINECRECCKTCFNLGYYDDRKSSWYYCSKQGDAYTVAANKIVDHLVETVFEKPEGEIFPRFRQIFNDDPCEFCISHDHISNEILKSNLDLDIKNYCLRLITLSKEKE